MNFREKIKKFDEIIKIRENARRNGRIVVTTNGSYDIVHVGHARSLQESKNQGDILIVGINSDKSVKAYKSKDRPIVPEESRAEMIAALECVDNVFLFDELNPIKFLEILKPDIHTNGADYGKDCIEKETVLKNGGKLHILKKYEGISTTDIVNKILKVYKND